VVRVGSWKSYFRTYGVAKASLAFTRWSTHTAHGWVANLRKDVGARMRGTCNNMPWPERGGYSHWRCQLKRWHADMHRFNNYIWSNAHSVEYAPIDYTPSGLATYSNTKFKSRHMTSTIRQWWAWRKMLKEGKWF
jgi:hypothetical protein